MSEMLREEEGRLMMEALDGFLIFVGKNGRIIYVSEEVERHTGVTAVSVLSPYVSRTPWFSGNQKYHGYIQCCEDSVPPQI